LVVGRRVIVVVIKSELFLTFFSVEVGERDQEEVDEECQ
jgi:hypothetical protein